MHCFLLTVNIDQPVAIKSGFSSGYRGEGPKGLSAVLQLLYRHKAVIEEVTVKKEIIEEIDGSCLSDENFSEIMNSRPVRPSRWTDYIIDDSQLSLVDNESLRIEFPKTIPFGIIDSRIVDLALVFQEHPDNAIMSGFRRLEELVRKRTNIESANGAKLFSKAFQGESPILHWEGIDDSEQRGRASMFSAIYMAYRNPRAHKESDNHEEESLREFLLLNELFLLESSSVLRRQSEN